MALLRLHGYRDSSEPFLFSGATSTKISCNGSSMQVFDENLFSSVFWFFTSQSAFFQSCCDRSSWDEPVLSRGSCLAQGHQKILHRKNALGHFQIFYQLIYYDY